jgi:hypothetical protein
LICTVSFDRVSLTSPLLPSIVYTRISGESAAEEVDAAATGAVTIA